MELPQQPIPKPRQRVSPVRNVIAAVVLLVLVVIAFFEYSAWWGVKQANQKLERVLGNEEGDLMSMEEVNALIGNKPDGPGVEGGEQLTVTYSWKGLLRKYTIYAIYKRGSTPRLLQISDQPPAK